jgi:PAS domain-containing protein
MCQINPKVGYGEILQNIPVGIHLYEQSEDGNMMLREANRVADKILRIDHNTLLGKNIVDIFPGIPDYKDILDKGFSEFKSGNEWYEVRPFSVNSKFKALTVQDITNRKEAEEVINKLEEKLRIALGLVTNLLIRRAERISNG